MSRARIAVMAVLIALLGSCEGKLGGPGGPGTGGGAGGGVFGDGGTLEDGGCPPQSHNDEIRLALAPACAACHTTGNKPYFASLSAFENGLVYDPKWVTLGDPDNSGLIKIMQGTNGGSYPQMPPGQTYADVLAAGRVSITIDEVKAWIATLQPRGAVNDGPSPEAFNVRRLRADEMVVSLMDQLGLGVPDFVDTSSANWRDTEWTARGGRLFVWPTDWAPGISTQYVSDSRTTERYETLGGPVILQGRKPDISLGPASMQTLVQMSQAWCKLAIEKSGNTAVLRYVTLADTSTTKPAEVRRNASQLWLRMLGEEPSDAELTELIDRVYKPLEPAPGSTKAAWTAVCAALVRHPKWLAY